MTLQAYQGHFENGLFYSEGQAIRIPERKTVVLTILESPSLIDILQEGHRDAIANGTSEMTMDEINDIISEYRRETQA